MRLQVTTGDRRTHQQGVMQQTTMDRTQSGQKQHEKGQTDGKVAEASTGVGSKYREKDKNKQGRLVGLTSGTSNPLAAMSVDTRRRVFPSRNSDIASACRIYGRVSVRPHSFEARSSRQRSTNHHRRCASCLLLAYSAFLVRSL